MYLKRMLILVPTITLILTIVDLIQGASSLIPGSCNFRIVVSRACTLARMAKSSVISPYSTRIAESPALYDNQQDVARKARHRVRTCLKTTFGFTSVAGIVCNLGSLEKTSSDGVKSSNPRGDALNPEDRASTVSIH